MKKFAEFDHIENFTGFGLYDHEVIQRFKENDDIYPYMRGIVSEIPYKKAYIDFHQPLRKLKKENINPVIVTNLKGSFVECVIPSSAISTSVNQLFLVLPFFLTAVGYFIFKI